MAVYGVWINNLDVRLPRIALFAIKDIQKGEELTFDYMMTGTLNAVGVLSPVICCLWAARLKLYSMLVVADDVHF